MENYNYKTLKSVREAQGLTQEQMAERLNMTQSNYSKLENNHKKINSIEMWNRLAHALNISDAQVEALLTQKEVKLDADSVKIIESLQDQIKVRENFIENFIHSAFNKYSSKYEEGIPWEDFGEHEIGYVVEICEITTKEEYESIGYPLVTKVSDENNQIAFEEMIDNMNIYSCFEFGLVSDKHYLDMWAIFKKKDSPKFKYEVTEKGMFTARTGYEDLLNLADSK